MATQEKEEKLRELDEWIKSNPDSRELEVHFKKFPEEFNLPAQTIKVANF